MNDGNRKKPAQRTKAPSKPTGQSRRTAQGTLELELNRLNQLPAADLKKLVHELGTYKLELEMQNEELRRAQAEVGASRAKYADLYEFAPLGYFTFDRRGVVKDVNFTGSTMLAAGKRQLLEAPVLSFIAPPDRPVFIDHLAAVFASATKQTIEIELRSGQGATLHVRLESLVVDGNTDLCRTAMSDVTDRHHIEETLRQSENLFRLITERSSEIIFQLDLQGRVEYVSPAAARYGFDPKKLLRTVFSSFVFPEDLPRAQEAFLRAGAGEQISVLELRLLRKDGSCYPAEISVVPIRQEGRVVGVQGISRDVSERKQAAEALRESARLERRRAEELAAMLEAVPMPAMIVHDPESTHITGNRAADELLRRPRGAEISLSAPPETRPSHFRPFKDGRELRLDELPAQRAARGEHVRDFAFSLLFDDGTTRHLLGYGTPLLDEQGQPRGAVHVLVDITELKLAEAALWDHELKASALINAVDESIWLFDLAGTILAANNTAARRLGMSVEEVVGRNWHALIPAALAVTREAILSEVVRTQSPGHFEDERAGIIFDHSIYPVRDSSGQLQALALFSRDITKRKQAELERERLAQELRQRAIELDTVFKAMPVLVSLHANDGTYLRVNRAFIELFGFDPTHARREEIARRVQARFPDGRPLTPENMPSSRVLQGEMVTGVEYLVTNAKGEERVLLFNAVPLRMEGRVYGMVLAQLDITERKQAETEIQLLNAQLRHKVAELETANQELEGFTYSVSHDLRAPIRHIAGFAKVLEMKGGNELKGEYRKYLAQITNAAERLGMLTDALLEFSRMGRKEIGMAKVDLGRLITEVVENLRDRTTCRRIEWRLHELPVVIGDATMLRFVVENLLNNAVKYSGKRELARIEVGYTEDDRGYIVFVKDNGSGFDMAYYDKLFGVFQRLHNQDEFDGTGIGLANVQRIIHRHGGEVWAESKIDQGATFYFSLPKQPQGQIDAR